MQTSQNIKDFFCPEAFIRVKTLQNHSKTINKILDIYENSDNLVTDMSEKDALELLTSSERIALLTRQLLTNKGNAQPLNNNDNITNSLGFTAELPVSVTFADSILDIFVPSLVARTKKESWYLVSELRAALEKYIHNNGRVDISPPILAVVKRYVSSPSHRYQDNDNFERSRLLNEVFEKLGYSDSPQRVGYVSLLELSTEKVGTEIIILPLSKLDQYTSILKFGVSKTLD